MNARAHPGVFDPLNQNDVLAKAGTDLSVLASQGRLHGAVGVERYVASIVRAMLRSDKASIALVGPPGTGKSAIVEQIAIEQVAGRLPEPLASRRLIRTSFQELAGLQPPGRDQNDYWHYVSRFIEEARNATVFLDECQALAYWPMTSQTLKPYLARGELRIIAATTPNEFDRYIGRDPALERRFQIVRVHPPNNEQLRVILAHAAQRFGIEHHVRFSEAALDACVQLSEYLPQYQPDAALDLLELSALQGSLRAGAPS